MMSWILSFVTIVVLAFDFRTEIIGKVMAILQ